MTNKKDKKLVDIYSKLTADDDKKVAEMVEHWDEVECKICGKKISMLKAKLVGGGKYYVCKHH